MTIEHLLIFAVGCFAGIMTGLMGASGMMAVVPGLILLGYSTYEAIGVSLAVDVVAASIVSVAYFRHGHVDLRRGIWIAVAAVIGAQIGSRLLYGIPEMGLNGVFGVLLLLSAVSFWRDGVGRGGVGIHTNRFREAAFTQWLERYPAIVSIVIGLGVGIISGMLGVGGGILFMFALLLLGYPLHVAVGTSTMIMALTTFSGAIGHAAIGNLPYDAVFYAALGTVLGSVSSSRLANRLSEGSLSRAIAIVFVILGTSLIVVTVWQR